MKNLEATNDASKAAYLAVAAGIAMAAIAFFQLIMFYRQLKLMGNTNKNAELAATAA